MPTSSRAILNMPGCAQMSAATARPSSALLDVGARASYDSYDKEAPMRLNARLTDELARKLEALERATGQSTSDVVRSALERYFDEVCGPARSAKNAILGSGLVGCGEAEADLSATYKVRLHEALGRKHGHR
jgi:hypothetical protein